MMSVDYYYQGEYVVTPAGGNLSPVPSLNVIAKSYQIDSAARRKLISAAYKLKLTARNQLVFLTFTFFYYPSEADASEHFVTLIDNLKKTYNLGNYVWTKERQKSGRIHYHTILDIPFFDIQKLENTWSTIIRHKYPHLSSHNNSIRLPNSGKYGNLVTGVHTVAEYIAKYCSKSNERYKFRAYQISKGLFPVTEKIDYTSFLKQLYDEKVEKKHNLKFGAVYSQKKKRIR